MQSVNPRGAGGRGSRHRVMKPGQSRLLAAQYVWFFICRGFLHGDAPTGNGKRRPEKLMSTTCAEQGRKQAPSAKKYKSRWKRLRSGNERTLYMHTTPYIYVCIISREMPHGNHAAVYCYIHFNEMPPRDPGGAEVREIG